MKNFQNEADIVTLTAPAGGVTSGLGYVIGAIFVVAQTSALAGEQFTGVRLGRFILPKTAAQALTQGQKVWWNNTTKVLVNVTGTGLFEIGCATDAALAADTVGTVVLNGAAVTAAP